MGAPATVEIDGQYRLLREGAGLVDRSERGKLLVRGPDAAEYLEGQLTNEVQALDPGRGCYAALLDRKGHLQSDLRALRLAPDRIWLDTEALAAERLRRHLDLHKIGRQVEVADVSRDHAILSLIGPEATAAVSAAVGGEVATIALEHAHREIELGRLRCRAVATELGIDLICSAEDRNAVHGALLEAGVGEVSEEAAEILRIESGRPRYGAEMSEATMPAEAGITERAVSFTKGCYVGQEPVARLHYKGRPNRFLRGLRLAGPVRSGEPVRLGDREVGRVGTACISPALGPIALAILRREAGPGDRVEIGDEATPAEVVEPPFAGATREEGA